MLDINWKPDNKNLRVFGIAALVVFGGFGAWAFFSGKLFGFNIGEDAGRIAGWVLWSLAAFGGIFGLIAPRVVLPLYVGMTLITIPIGFVVSYLAMGLVFYGLLTPIGLFFRLIGRDQMNRKLDPAAPSYWGERRPQTDSKRYFRQF